MPFEAGRKSADKLSGRVRAQMSGHHGVAIDLAHQLRMIGLMDAEQLFGLEQQHGPISFTGQDRSVNPRFTVGVARALQGRWMAAGRRLRGAMC
jgi:hypothetical protein